MLRNNGFEEEDITLDGPAGAAGAASNPIEPQIKTSSSKRAAGATTSKPSATSKGDTAANAVAATRRRSSVSPTAGGGSSLQAARGLSAASYPGSAGKIQVKIRLQIDNKLLPEAPDTAAIVTLSTGSIADSAARASRAVSSGDAVHSSTSTPAGRTRNNVKVPGIRPLSHHFVGKFHDGWYFEHPSDDASAGSGDLPTLTMVLYTPGQGLAHYTAAPPITSMPHPNPTAASNVINAHNGLIVPVAVYRCMYNPTGKPPQSQSTITLPKVVLTGDVPKGRMEFPGASWLFYYGKDGKRVTKTALSIGGAMSLGLHGRQIVSFSRIENGGLELQIAPL